MDNSGLKVIIAAAGKATRMGSKINKPYLNLNNYPVLAYSLCFFERFKICDEVVIIAADGELEHCRQNIVEKYKFSKVSAILPGGRERQDSIWVGLKFLQNRNCKLVAVHDSARPLLSPPLMEKLIITGIKWNAAIPGIRVKDTMKFIDDNNFVASTPERKALFAIQTPQIFNYQHLYNAYIKAEQENFKGTDDAMLYEKYIGKVKVVETSHNNPKITTPDDLIIVKALADHKGGCL